MPKEQAKRVRLHPNKKDEEARKVREQEDEEDNPMLKFNVKKKEERRKLKRALFLKDITGGKARAPEEEQEQEDAGALDMKRGTSLEQALQEVCAFIAVAPGNISPQLQELQKERQEKSRKVAAQHSRRAVLEAEAKQMSMVLSHPQYSQNALSVIHRHLSSTLPQAPAPVGTGFTPEVSVAARREQEHQRQIAATAVQFLDSPLAQTALKMAHSKPGKGGAKKGAAPKGKGKKR
ncbi:hypothetical protein PAPYR_1281 [Paratrimastix pyriformis]|uniref:Ribosome biogenesis protein NOP53 n=1 Tax=Paratrimastix pyriformis TaxID=342808 RepID=A0ABQ8UVH8_9EUKA|nr:hypothetical protein PAPYR_1281 [Paratrimastix pyriformis]